jgi:4-alpha-glucanotransferase
MDRPRASGILVHPTSFPGRFGIGDLGAGATQMLDFLAAARQKLWQVLPLGPTGYGDSPYASLSAFAGNPLLISPERLLEENLLAPADLEATPPFDPNQVDFGTIVPWKTGLLRTSFARFQQQVAPRLREDFEAFCTTQRAWLDDFALFMALKAAHDGASWVQWGAPYARRDPEALAEASRGLAAEIAFHRYAQFLFVRQWTAVRQAARERDISIVGDVAIVAAHDSADVWAHPELFHLDDAGNPTVVAGVPPDYFSPTGQRWGNPLYRWDVLAATGYAWWIARVRRALELEDIIRLDHFRGFLAHWEIPACSETAVEGHWVSGPGAALFTALRESLGEVPAIAEDLGVITPDVDALRQQLGLPGMRILQFAFDSDAANHDLPHNFERNAVVCTGTHDNDTTRGWFQTRKGRERSYAQRYLACEPRQIVSAMIRAALSSVANTTILPLQDVLGLGSEARMNYPSRAEGNWAWRCADRELTPECALRLAELVELYGRWTPRMAKPTDSRIRRRGQAE